MENESLIEFPCDFPVKIVGRAGEEFEELALAIVTRHAPDFDRDRASSRLSRDGNYVSLTCTIVARSQEQLDRLYQELSDHELVLMAL
jgi:putative lipoic acid-binding regulatory protein